jgi:hypothetical protein
MIHCEELERLSDESSVLFAEYLAIRDDFKLAKKNDPAYSEKAKSLKRVQGQLGKRIGDSSNTSKTTAVDKILTPLCFSVPSVVNDLLS